MTNGKTWAEALARLDNQIEQLQELQLTSLLSRLTALVENMLDAAGDAAANEYLTDPENIVWILSNALDQIIEIGTDETSQVFVDFAQQVGDAIGASADALGLTLEQVADITNQSLQYAAANNYDYIRQVIPQVRTDVTQVFADAIRAGEGQEYIQERLNYIGLPWSPTGRFSPGERAAMIANAEMSRIQQEMHAAIANEAGVDHCINMLNLSLSSHSDQCLAATAAGLIPTQDMIGTFGQPPRHPRCGCGLSYMDPEWGIHSKRTRGYLSELYSQGVDVDAAVSRWNDKGSLQTQARSAYRERLGWENNTIRQLFPEGGRR